MKGICLSLLSFFLFVVASIFLVRAYRGRKFFHLFLAEFPFVFLFYLFLFRFLPQDLGVLPDFLVEPSPAVDFWNGVFLLVLLFHIFWDAAYATVFTGFSSELTVQLFHKGDQGLSVDEALLAFGDDRELDRILAWRMPNLLKGGCLAKEGERYRLLPKGRMAGRLGLFLKRLFCMDLEG